MSDEDDEVCEEPSQMEMAAGELHVFAQAEESDDALEAVQEMWGQALEDLKEMPAEERERIGLK